MTRVLAGAGRYLTVFEVDSEVLARAADLAAVEVAVCSADMARESTTVLIVCQTTPSSSHLICGTLALLKTCLRTASEFFRLLLKVIP